MTNQTSFAPFTPMPPMDVAARLPRLREVLADEPCDILVLSNLTNIRWLTGFAGSAGTVVVTDTECTLITDGRYAFQAPEQIAAAGSAVEVQISRSAKEQNQMLLATLEDGAVVGLEAEHISWATQLSWAEKLPQEPVPINGVVEKLRRCKDAGEIARIAKAAAIVDSALEEIFQVLASDATQYAEQELAADLDHQIRRRGASELAFETIVAAGPNSALPHARPSSRKIQRGELLLIDVGAVYDGYRSDMTRTFSLGQPSEAEAEIWQVVREAQQLGVEAVQAGSTTGAIDEVCRQRIKDAGLGEAFMHSTGHGVGLDIHEQPAVSAKTKEVLQAGEIITVEPGIYLQDLGGVRLEDTVLVQPDACLPLTKTPKFLTL